MKKKRNVIVITLLFLILLMTVGYATFVTQLNINGTAEIIGEWNVSIINVEATEVSEGCDGGTPEFTGTSTTFNAKLAKPGDSVTYLVTIKNAGTIDAVLSNIIYKEDTGGSPDISYTTTEIAHELNAGETTTYEIKIEYNKDANEAPSVKTKSITGIVEYSQNTD